MLNHILRLQCEITLWSAVLNKIMICFFITGHNGQICDNSYPFQSTYSRSTVSFAIVDTKTVLVHVSTHVST